MEGSSLFNSGFLGANFNWWIGQIADDSTWRENISSAKIQDLKKIPGWGYRYKVRIIGLHDKEEETIPSDQLPWAQVMYPITSGGGQSGSSATPNLRQGNFVFGFFLDGADQQVPVIMGVLGNNPQTKLNNQIGTTNSNFSATSGFAQPATGAPDPNNQVPDNKISLDSNPNPTIEHPNPNQQSVADVKRQEIYDMKITLMNPCDMVGSALKIIQTKLEELISKINKILAAITCYIDAITNLIKNILALIADFACQIAKYLKIIFDKMMEYIMKMINKAMAPTVQSLPPNKRSLYLTIKEKIVELIHCLFNKLINNLCGQVEKSLKDNLNIDNIISTISTSPQTPVGISTTSVPVVPSCAAEDLVASVIYTNQTEIDEEIQRIVVMIDNFLGDVASDLASSGVTNAGGAGKGSLGAVAAGGAAVLGGVAAVEGGVATVGNAITNVGSFVNGIAGSLLTALNFQNLSLSVFGCDIKPKCPISDYYNLQQGGGGLKQSQIPSKPDTANKASQEQSKIESTGTSIPFATPAKDEQFNYDN